MADYALAPAAGSRVLTPGVLPIRFPCFRSGRFCDNLRRSLVPVGLLLFMLGGWLLLPELEGLGSLLVLGDHRASRIVVGVGRIFRKPADLPWAMHLRAAAGSYGRQLGQIFLTLAFLPYDAYISLDAIGRTLLRLLLTHKRLLEWRTSSDSERTARADLPAFMPPCGSRPSRASGRSFPGCLAARPIVAGRADPRRLAGRSVDRLVDQPADRIRRPRTLTAEQCDFLRRTARKTWHFFETFVTAQENWLPPDNFQEVPVPTIASRTSPTNMGLALLANLAAWDLGYLSAGGLMRRTQDALATMQRLERYRGHFYNWYETRTLQPLLPLYVSSVDSGNLAGHLLTLGAGLREQAEEKIFRPQIFAGLRDTVGILRDLAGEKAALTRLEEELEQGLPSLRAAIALLEKAAAQAAEIAAALAGEAEELKGWSLTLKRNCEAHLADILFLAPWLALPPGLTRESRVRRHGCERRQQLCARLQKTRST